MLKKKTDLKTPHNDAPNGHPKRNHDIYLFARLNKVMQKHNKSKFTLSTQWENQAIFIWQKRNTKQGEQTHSLRALTP